MNKNNDYVIIMAGGIGSRFWPFSRNNRPKQFQDILGTGQTLIQQTAERFDNICPRENIYIVTNESYKALVQEQLPFMSEEQILLEPMMRNTAPCIAYATYKIYKENPEANLLIAPADHLITKPQEFEKVANTALQAASENNILVTLGINPSRPDTGYGYIQYDQQETMGDLNKVKQFTEKPQLALAEEFVADGNYLWNAGIFIWSAASVIQCFKNFLPKMDADFSALNEFYYTSNEKQEVDKVYEACENISIDYGIMENATNVYVIPCDFGWSDLGTWKSLYEVSPKNNDNNVLQGHILAYETKDCIVKTPSDRLVVIQGLENYIVAEKDNVLVICSKDQEQRIKEFVSAAKKEGQEFT